MRNTPPIRTELQRRGPQKRLSHLLRDVRRVGVLMIGDVVASTGSLYLLSEVLGTTALWPTPAGMLSGGSLGRLAFVAGVVIGLLLARAYVPGDSRRGGRRLLVGAFAGPLLLFWVPMWTAPALLWLPLLISVMSTWLLLIIVRCGIETVAAKGRHASRSLLVGTRAKCLEAEGSPIFGLGGPFTLVGYVAADTSYDDNALGKLSDLDRLIIERNVDSVVVCGNLGDEHFAAITDATLQAGCELVSFVRSHAMACLHQQVTWSRGVPLVIHTRPSLRAGQLVIKRIFDILASAVGLVVLAPLILLIAVLIKIDSPGPVFFRQIRIGLGARKFQILKFRTMSTDTSDEVHRKHTEAFINGTATPASMEGAPTFKLVDDARITRVGAFLRRFSLDELPQLVNVVRGEMSLVGPRPVLPYEIEFYEPEHFDRLQAKPGITGLWQVSGRNRLSHDRMCMLDIQYARRWSLGLDLKILLKTIPVVITNSGGAA